MRAIFNDAVAKAAGTTFFLAGCLTVILSHPSTIRAADATEQQRLVNEATSTFERFLDNPRMGSWYRAQGKNIKAVMIIPRFVRGAFLVGAAGGKGVLLAQDFVHGGWSPPAFYHINMAGIGPQAGFDSAEVVLIVQTFSSLERFSGSGTFKMGVDSDVTIGAVGEGGTTGLDIVTFSWSRGAFIGLSFDGLAITASDSSNETYYGQAVKPEQILANETLTNPGAAKLRAALARPIFLP